MNVVCRHIINYDGCVQNEIYRSTNYRLHISYKIQLFAFNVVVFSLTINEHVSYHSREILPKVKVN